MEAEVIGLQETRLSEQGQLDMTTTLQQQGWQSFWGRPQEPQHRAQAFVPSPWNATHGGVGIVVRSGIPAQPAPLDTPRRQALWNTGRWLHVMVGTGNGRQVLHVMTVYGHTGSSSNAPSMSQNEDLLNEVLTVAAELGNVPVIVLGDINIDPSEST
eukprot:11267179-Karenia_brevis.AAC.1